jgi:hypothetical protein
LTIVSFPTYYSLTRDYNTEPADIATYLELSQELIEDELHRKFDHATVPAEKVTVVYNRDGIFWLGYPSRRPVTAVTTLGWEVTNTGLVRSTSVPFTLPGWLIHTPNMFVVDLSYSGGYTDETAPKTLQLAICQFARHLLTQSPATSIPAGVSNVKVGKLSANISAEQANDLTIPANIMSKIYRYRSGFTPPTM